MAKPKKPPATKPDPAPAPSRATLGDRPAWGPAHTWIAFTLLMIFSVALGLAAVYQYRDSPFFNLPIIDEEAYVKWADQIAAGDWIGTTVFYQDPLYPYFLAFIFTALGKSFMTVRVVQELLLAASMGIVFLTARRLWGDRAALLAALVLLLYQGLFYFGLMLVKAPLVVFLSAVSCALGVWAAEGKPRLIRFAGVGVTLGLLTLLRGNFQAVIPFMLVWAALDGWRESWRGRLLRPLYLAAGLAVIIVPVTVRNYVIDGEIVLTTSQAGANFYLGNNELANGRYATLPFVRANPEHEAIDFKAEADKRTGRDLTPSEVSAFWFDESFKWIKQNPGPALRLFFHKARLMVHRHEIADNHSFYLMRELFVPALWLPFLNLGLLWGPALVGMAVMARRDRRAWYPALFTILYTASMVPFFIVDRYRAPVLPALALYCAAYIQWLSERSWRDWLGRDFSQLAAALAVVGGFWLIGLLPTTESRAPLGVEYYLLGNAYLKTGHPDEAVPWYRKALETLPDHEDAHKNLSIAMGMMAGTDIDAVMAEVRREGKTAEELAELGRRLEGMGQFKLAVEAYEKAASRDSKFYPAQARLGFLYATNPEVRDLDRAVSHLLTALEIDPNNADTANALGNVYFLSGKQSEARRWWEQTLKLKPDHAGARANLEKLGN